MALKPIKAPASSALAFEPVVPHAVQPRMSGGAVGKSGSEATLNRLTAATAELKAIAATPMLQRAVEFIKADQHDSASKWALKALELDERNGLGWYVLAIARERAGDFDSSIRAYESALALIPEEAEIANDLGRLAYRIGMKEVARKLFAHYLQLHPDSEEAANNIACTFRDDRQYEQAIDVLRPSIARHPENPILWNTLGTVVSEQGDSATALTFFNEALVQDPDFAKARYNRGNALYALGDVHNALIDCDSALSLTTAPDEIQMMRLARSTLRLAQGLVGDGWDDYEARLDPNFADVTLFHLKFPKWEPGSRVRGKRVLVVGEQGLGDEVLFSNVLPDLIEDIGPDGQLLIAVEKRLVPLFQRSFPKAIVGEHGTGISGGRTVRLVPMIEAGAKADLWVPMASLLRQYRRTVADFPGRSSFLKADSGRVQYWQDTLKARSPAPTIGLLWKSLKLDGNRHQNFDVFDVWEPVLKRVGLTFINMQYGETAAELAIARDKFGIDIWTPEGIDLRNDLDDVAALSCALDLMIGPPNATTNIAAACGANLWIVSNPVSWPRLGTEAYPWYPKARAYIPEKLGVWGEIMTQIDHDLTKAYS